MDSKALVFCVALLSCVWESDAIINWCASFGLFCSLSDCVNGQPSNFFCDLLGFLCPIDCNFRTCSQFKERAFTIDGEEVEFDFDGLPLASSDVNLRVEIQGDVNGNDPDENALVFGEGNFLIGTTEPTGNPTFDGCSRETSVDSFTIPKGRFNDWNSNDEVEIKVDLQIGVEPPCNKDEVRVTLTYTGIGGGC